MMKMSASYHKVNLFTRILQKLGTVPVSIVMEYNTMIFLKCQAKLVVDVIIFFLFLIFIENWSCHFNSH